MNNPTMIRSIGQVADDAANVATELPLKVGAVADDAVSEVADADKVHLVTDLYRRLRVNAEGGAANNAAAVGNPVYVAGLANDADPTYHENDAAALSLTLGGRLRVDTIGIIADNQPAGTPTPVITGTVAYDPASLPSLTAANAATAISDLQRRLIVAPQGSVADDAADDASPPVKIGFRAMAPATLGDPVSANDRVAGITDLQRRQIVAPQGSVLDDVADDGTPPIKTGGIAKDPATLGDLVTAGDRVSAITDLNRRLIVAPQGSVADAVADDNSNPIKVGSIAKDPTSLGTNATAGDRVQLIADLNRRLIVNPMGNVADGTAADATPPIKLGAKAEATPAGTGIATGDMATLITDLYRRLRTVIARETLNASWVDSDSVEADAYYPSEGGLDLAAFETVTLTGKVICGADNTSVLTLQVTNDEDATPGNRDWITIYYYRNDTDANEASIATGAGATSTFGISLNGLDFRYVRAYYNTTVGTTNKDTVIIKGRYTA